MIDRRKKDVNWNVADNTGATYSNLRDGCAVAVLMDIRDELKRLNELLHCLNFQAIPHKLDRIAHNTHKNRRRRKKVSA